MSAYLSIRTDTTLSKKYLLVYHLMPLDYKIITIQEQDYKLTQIRIKTNR
jgi:hypothetical protein